MQSKHEHTRENRKDLTANCLLDNNPLSVPRNVVSKRGEVREEYRSKTLPNGVYVSKEGNFYCEHRHWVLYCDD